MSDTTYGSTDRPYYANTFYGIPFAPGGREALAASAYRAIRKIRAEIGIVDDAEEPTE